MTYSTDNLPPIGTQVRTTADLPAVAGTVIGHGTATRRGYMDDEGRAHPSKPYPVVLIEPAAYIDARNRANGHAFPVSIFVAHPESIEPAEV